jgi:hypothetical protein
MNATNIRLPHREHNGGFTSSVVASLWRCGATAAEWAGVSSDSGRLLEFYENAFGVVTHGAFKSAAILVGRFGLNASEHQLGAALWALGTYDGSGCGLLENWHIMRSHYQAGVLQNSQSPTPEGKALGR